ncbi:WD40 repeat domain-containing protein [Streptomyces virginiae]|uniref:WD40 repeat domain-containing protein n=1 Tax=Streptomyces virginiae TaxID=1961 RepID=UPI003696F1F7
MRNSSGSFERAARAESLRARHGPPRIITEQPDRRPTPNNPNQQPAPGDGDPLIGHASRAQALAFSPDGRFLASTSEDGTVRLWDPYTREPIGGPLVTSRDREVPESDHDAPFEGVPEHLQLPLQEWVASALSFEAFGAYLDEDDAERTLCLRLRIAVEADGSNQSGSKYRRALTMAVGPRLLDVVDAVLSYKAERGLVDQAQADIRLLTKILDAAGSAYRVTEAGSGLEKRVIPAVRDAVRGTIAAAAAVSAAGLAGDHLARAWRAAYGRSPDAVRAQSEAIWAVESAAHAVIQPNNSKATLGTMLGELKNARHKFSTAIPSPAGNPIAPVEAMMRALWEGRTSRHGAHTGTVPETLEAARAGVHLAAALVQWFVSGAVTRTP